MTLYGGIETGGTRCACVIGSGRDDIVAEACFTTTTPTETTGRMVGFFQQHAREYPVAAIGIGSFGPLDLDRQSPTYGFITTTPKPGWAHVDLRGPVADTLQVPMVFDTDVNAAALGEYLWGAGASQDTGVGTPTSLAEDDAAATTGGGAASAAQELTADPLLYLTVGTGIGLGVIIGGEPLHGLLHPEAGHMLVPHDHATDPFEGACPFHGDCWEGLASGFAIESRWGQRGEALPSGHPAWELEAHYLGLGIANLVYCFSPRRVVVGGGVLRHPGLLERTRREIQESIRGYLQTEPLTQGLEHLVVPPRLGARSGVLGALALAIRG